MPLLEVFVMRGSPPSYAVLALLKEMKIPYKATELDYFGGDQFKEDFTKVRIV
jgi:glutathione S-transferase